MRRPQFFEFCAVVERMGEMEEKRAEQEIVIKGRFLAWLDNFWYHYKWPFLGILAAGIIVLVCTLQTCSKEKEDVVILYGGPTYLSTTQTRDLARMMDGILPYDFDRNGEKRAALSTYQIYSEEQIRQITAETDSEGHRGFVDHSHNADQYKVYSDYLMTGESSVLLLDPWLYDQLRQADRLCPLEEVCAFVPSGAVDGFGIRLGDTELYRAFGVYQALPEDTVICLLQPYVVGRSSKAEAYQFEVDVFLSLIGAEAKK